VHLHRTLTDCLLTDAELSRGEQAWRQLADPFTRAYPAFPAGGAARPYALSHDDDTTKER
jgi:hypothetical protein